jgi:hypothetical protein
MTEMNFESVRLVAVDRLRIRYMRGGKRSEIPLLLTSPWPERLSCGRARHRDTLLLSASQHPDRFERLVVGSGATDVATAAGRLKDINLAPSTSAFEGTDGAVKRMMRTTPDPRVLQDYAASSAGRRFVEAMAFVRAYPADLPALHELLPSIRTPVLSIWGSQDPLVPPINAEILDKSLPSTRSVLLDSSHFVSEDHADAYATAIVEWIEGRYRSAPWRWPHRDLTGQIYPRCQAVRGAWHSQLANACIRYQWTLKRPV